MEAQQRGRIASLSGSLLYCDGKQNNLASSLESTTVPKCSKFG
jgi:hypothetical protein